MNTDRPLRARIGEPEALSAQLDKSVSELNAIYDQRKKPSPLRHEIYDFVSLAEKLAEALVQAAQTNLTMAENSLRDAEAHAAEVRERAKIKSDEIFDMTERLKEFGQSVLSARDKFLGDEAPK